MILIAAAVLASASPAYPSAVAPLIAAVTTENDLCRDSSGDDPATQRACDRRDELAAELQGMGWCFGRTDEVEARRRWRRCQAER